MSETRRPAGPAEVGERPERGEPAESAERAGPVRRAPGRPRSERAGQAIIEATLDLLAESGGVAAVSIEAVAARAGVGKTTIYRRWPTKEELIVAALATIKHPLPRLSGRSVREDLVAIARVLGAEQLRKHSRCIWNVMGAADKYPGLLARYRLEVLEPRREVMRAVLRRGIETGELRPDTDVEVTMLMLVGAMTMRNRMAPVEMGPGLPEKVVDGLLRGVRGPG